MHSYRGCIIIGFVTYSLQGSKDISFKLFRVHQALYQVYASKKLKFVEHLQYLLLNVTQERPHAQYHLPDKVDNLSRKFALAFFESIMDHVFEKAQKTLELAQAHKIFEAEIKAMCKEFDGMRDKIHAACFGLHQAAVKIYEDVKTYRIYLLSFLEFIKLCIKCTRVAMAKKLKFVEHLQYLLLNVTQERPHAQYHLPDKVDNLSRKFALAFFESIMDHVFEKAQKTLELAQAHKIFEAEIKAMCKEFDGMRDKLVEDAQL
ncbi:hypothetical protein Tco_1037608 [Tanacetum coccineum]